ncbi:LysR family transcriptional regulator [Piscirickettsia litoralis]|uniref:HTH lysR-type domain-containing protein n=1 Tax=Piscirickettsia litoralis TaxID=1891921 RepID=A0ABX3A2H8_9GAMM|nr:LysR family transcriptional regulator [Piscirickettsia litoralis]ODN43076.1 hypothetical protein BGC07_09315 [Piscirickettsia litoralis]
MNIRNFNLNLLHTLNTLLKEKSVSITADKLHLSQPAVSHALKQLRQDFNDALLVRSRQGLELTPFAKSIQSQVEDILISTEKLITAQQEFDPYTSDRTFNIATLDFAEMVLVPHLLKWIHDHNSNMKIRVCPLKIKEAYDLLDLKDKQIDIVISLDKPAPTHIHRDILFESPLFCIMRKDHPFAHKKMTTSDFMNAEHLALQPNDELQIIPYLKQKRKVSLTTYHPASIPRCLQYSDLIATLPRGLAFLMREQGNLKIQKCPIKVPKVRLIQAWNKKNQQDPGHQWFREFSQKMARQARAENKIRYKDYE